MNKKRTYMLLRKIPILSNLLAALDSLHGEINRLYTTIAKLDTRLDNNEVLIRTLSSELIKDATAHGVIGVAGTDADPAVVVSLTTYPARIHKVTLPIYSLLRQTYKPYVVVLWLAQEQFPAGEAELPDQLLSLKDIGLTIKWCEDIKSFKKIIPSLKEYPDHLIVTADDDIYYQPDWLEQLMDAYRKEPDTVHVHRCHRISLASNGNLTPYHSWERNSPLGQQPSPLNFPTSGAGVLYFPGCFHNDVTNTKLVMELTPRCDDIWQWVMLVLKRTAVKRVMNSHHDFIPVGTAQSDQVDSLFEANKAQAGELRQKDLQLQRVIGYYPDILRILHEA